MIMKTHRLLIMLFLASTISSCKFFRDQKLFSNDIDTLIELQTVAEEKPVVDTPEVVIEETPAPPVINNKYFMIVGSFQVEKNAEHMAAELTEQGYHAEIHYSSNGFYRVSAKGYEDFRVGVSEINEFRNRLTPNAWLYVKR